jgi:hypothetical protein
VPAGSEDIIEISLLRGNQFQFMVDQRSDIEELKGRGQDGIYLGKAGRLGNNRKIGQGGKPETRNQKPETRMNV